MSMHRDIMNVMREENKEKYDRLTRLECRSMAPNLLIAGIPEQLNENEASLISTIQTIFKDAMRIKDDVPIAICHRLGESLRRKPGDKESL